MRLFLMVAGMLASLLMLSSQVPSRAATDSKDCAFETAAYSDSTASAVATAKQALLFCLLASNAQTPSITIDPGNFYKAFLASKTVVLTNAPSIEAENKTFVFSSGAGQIEEKQTQTCCPTASGDGVLDPDIWMKIDPIGTNGGSVGAFRNKVLEQYGIPFAANVELFAHKPAYSIEVPNWNWATGNTDTTQTSDPCGGLDIVDPDHVVYDIINGYWKNAKRGQIKTFTLGTDFYNFSADPNK